MYAIDINICTAKDIIRRSVVCHPSLFAERMRETARMHGNYSAETTNKKVSAIARKMSADCRAIADLIEVEDVNAICATVGFTVQAYTIAARLQLIPRWDDSNIIERTAAPRFNVSYEIVTQESAEQGEAEERGFIGQCLRLREALKALHETRTSAVGGVECIEPNESGTGFSWVTITNSMEYETGACESRSIFLPREISAASRARILRLIKA